MIPKSDIGIWYGQLPEDLAIPTRASVQDGYLDGNRDFNPALVDADWKDAEEALEVEDRLVNRASQAPPEEFDQLDGDLEDWELIALEGLDAGVAAATLALNAAGCVTTTSCRSHPGRVTGGIDYPRIRFLADGERGALVQGIAREVGCGLAVDEDRILEVWAPSVVEMLEFARRVLSQRSTFSRLPDRWPQSRPSELLPGSSRAPFGPERDMRGVSLGQDSGGK